MALVIDTHKIHSLLLQAGFEKNKADALLEAITFSYEELATKQDILSLRKDLLLTKKDLIIQQWAVGTAVVAVLATIRFFG